MFHLYLVTDTGGSFPLLRDEPLRDGTLPAGTAVVALLGRFDRRETASAALALARDAVCRQRKPDERGADAASRWLQPTPPPAPALFPQRGRRRSGRRSLPR